MRLFQTLFFLSFIVTVGCKTEVAESTDAQTATVYAEPIHSYAEPNKAGFGADRMVPMTLEGIERGMKALG